ncbi:hypothetical protein [Herbaspirillum sp. ST 5-3]|uniref:hypothetical protein n=1 Tax=Oxalobacteraceae TaxID=75682 RepID=UPI0010A4345B|nr:hypothetical protein [Herbaspirillum sp. ST 5-3]
MTLSAFQTRFLEPEDISALMDLEHSKWELQQVAGRELMLQRISAYPELSIGTFCARTGQSLASLFMRPVNPAIFTAPTKWETAARVDGACAAHSCGRSLFGISLSSNHPEAVKAIFKFFYPRALKAGWRDVYLGSPIPGFRKARQKNPDLSVWEYVHAKRNFHADEPLDPQLKYYFMKGFRQIISIQENYFPHAESLNYGVILRSVIPLSRPRHLWRITPLSVIESFSIMGLWLAR